jgi:hypothetical protein
MILVTIIYLLIPHPPHSATQCTSKVYTGQKIEWKRCRFPIQWNNGGEKDLFPFGSHRSLTIMATKSVFTRDTFTRCACPPPPRQYKMLSKDIPVLLWFPSDIVLWSVLLGKVLSLRVYRWRGEVARSVLRIRIRIRIRIHLMRNHRIHMFLGLLDPDPSTTMQK